ncbi:MAG: Mu transposase C-terminal domain-containing protein [Methylobacter tundripaludum]|nr:Mu transposase C-terminal domain-containing protein [Methylobacter tundripaludum]
MNSPAVISAKAQDVGLRYANPAYKDTDKQLPARVLADPLTQAKRQQVSAFQTVCGYVLECAGTSDSTRINAFQQMFQTGQLPAPVLEALAVLRGKKREQCPDRATVYRWLSDLAKFKTGNVLALTKQHTGRVRQTYGWEHKAIELFNLPSKPGYADVAYWLRTDYGFDTATKSRVTRYLQTMPATLGKQSPERMGKIFYKHNLAPHKIRDNDVLPVGFGYEGDGHTVDAYIAHPSGKKVYRPELTIWIDVRSRYVAGWYLSDDESAVSTLFALSHALLAEDHVPAVLFMDNGSGFKSKMMADDAIGFLNRMSITPSFALPGNSKGKGLVEGFFKIFRNRHDKKFTTYCGDDMAPEINRRLSDEVKRGQRTLPTYAEYVASVKQYIDDYNNEPKGVLNGETPRQVWLRDLQQVKVHIAADALIMPREIRTVKKWRITLHKRKYQAPELAQYNGTDVLVEYSLHKDNEIRVLDEQERLICIATLVGKVDRLPESRIVEAEQKRLTGQVKRLELHANEKKLRAQPVLTLEEGTAALLECSDFNRLEQTGTLNFNADDAMYLGNKKEAVDEDLDLTSSF